MLTWIYRWVWARAICTWLCCYVGQPPKLLLEATKWLPVQVNYITYPLNLKFTISSKFHNFKMYTLILRFEIRFEMCNFTFGTKIDLLYTEKRSWTRHTVLKCQLTLNRWVVPCTCVAMLGKERKKKLYIGGCILRLTSFIFQKATDKKLLDMY